MGNQRRSNQFIYAPTAELTDLLRKELELPSGGDARAVADLIEELAARGDADLLAETLMHLDPRYNDFELQPRVIHAMLGCKESSALIWGYSKCLNMANGKAHVAVAKNERILQDPTLTDEQKRSVYLEVNPSFFTFEDYLSPNGEAARWGLDAETMLASISDPAIAAKQDSSVWSFAKERDRLFFTVKQRRTALFNKPLAGDALLSLVDVHLGRGASWIARDPERNIISDRHSRKVLRFIDEAALTKARYNIIDVVSGCNATQLANFKLEALRSFAVAMSDSSYPVSGDGEIIYDLRDGAERFIENGLSCMVHYLNNLAIYDLAKLSEHGGLGAMDLEVRRLLNNAMDFEQEQPNAIFPNDC